MNSGPAPNPKAPTGAGSEHRESIQRDAAQGAPDQDGVPGRLGEQTWQELLGESLLLAVPVGSCEQHGPHLPLNTDTLIAEALAAGLARRRPSVVVGPTIAVGSSGEHQDFPGTLSVGTDTLRDVLVELGRSALPLANPTATGSGQAKYSDPDSDPEPPEPVPPCAFSGVLFVNGHGGNAQAVLTATELLTREGRRVDSWSPRAQGGDAHAGHTETSLMMHLHPEVIRRDRLEQGNTSPLSDLVDTLRTVGVAQVSPNGVLGDPATATHDHGAELFGQLVEDLAATADAMSPAGATG